MKLFESRSTIQQRALVNALKNQDKKLHPEKYDKPNQSDKFDIKKDLPIGEMMVSKRGKNTNVLFNNLKMVAQEPQQIKEKPTRGQVQDDQNIDELFPQIKKDLTEQKQLEEQYEGLHPDIKKLRSKMKNLQTSATKTRELQVVEQKNRDKGKLKLLASESRRAQYHLAGKRPDFLDKVIQDHKQVMSVQRHQVKTDLDNGVFKGTITKAVKDCVTFNPADGFMRSHASSEFKAPSRASMEEYEFKHPGSYPALTHYRPNHDYILKKQPNIAPLPAPGANPGTVMKQAMFRKDFHICHKLINNLEIQRQSPETLRRHASGAKLNLSKIGSVAQLRSRRSSTSHREYDSQAVPSVAGGRSQSNPNLLKYQGKDLSDAQIGVHNYTSQQQLPALHESISEVSPNSRRKRKSTYSKARTQIETISEVPYENYLNSHDYVIVKNRALDGDQVESITIESKADCVRDVLRTNVEVPSHFSQQVPRKPLWTEDAHEERFENINKDTTAISKNRRSFKVDFSRLKPRQDNIDIKNKAHVHTYIGQEKNSLTSRKVDGGHYDMNKVHSQRFQHQDSISTSLIPRDGAYGQSSHDERKAFDYQTSKYKNSIGGHIPLKNQSYSTNGRASYIKPAASMEYTTLERFELAMKREVEKEKERDLSDQNISFRTPIKNQHKHTIDTQKKLIARTQAKNINF